MMRLSREVPERAAPTMKNGVAEALWGDLESRVRSAVFIADSLAVDPAHALRARPHVRVRRMCRVLRGFVYRIIE